MEAPRRQGLHKDGRGERGITRIAQQAGTISLVGVPEPMNEGIFVFPAAGVSGIAVWESQFVEEIDALQLEHVTGAVLLVAVVRIPFRFRMAVEVAEIGHGAGRAGIMPQGQIRVGRQESPTKPWFVLFHGCSSISMVIPAGLQVILVPARIIWIGVIIAPSITWKSVTWVNA